jgi:hypothetical protein
MVRTLIYKRTHTGDPNPRSGVWLECMGTVKSWEFDAVIGVGGNGEGPRLKGIAGKITFVGISPHKSGDPRRPKVTFDNFWCPDKMGPFLKNVAPVLWSRLSRSGRAPLRHPLTKVGRTGLNPDEFSAIEPEINRVLALAKDAGPSPARDEAYERKLRQRSNEFGRVSEQSARSRTRCHGGACDADKVLCDSTCSPSARTISHEKTVQQFS